MVKTASDGEFEAIDGKLVASGPSRTALMTEVLETTKTLDLASPEALDDVSDTNLAHTALMAKPASDGEFEASDGKMAISSPSKSTQTVIFAY